MITKTHLMEQAEKKSQGKVGPLRNKGDNQITNNFIMVTLMNCYLIPVTQKRKKTKYKQNTLIRAQIIE